jgi:hypothetical protein
VSNGRHVLLAQPAAHPDRADEGAQPQIVHSESLTGDA